MGASQSTSASSEEKVFPTEAPISFSPDVVNQLADRLGSTETTPERQSILDSHIRSRIRDEIEHLKRDEAEVRKEIELALEKENLEHEQAMAGEASESGLSTAGDIRSSASLLGDLEEMKTKIDKHQARRNREEFEVADKQGQAVAECYRRNPTRPLDCQKDVRLFKSVIGSLEQEQFKSL